MAKVAQAAAAPSSKPGTKAEAAAKPEKAKKSARVYYPGLEAKEVIVDGKPKLNKKGKPILRPSKKLATVPADYNAKLHKPLREDDFEDPAMYHELRAQEYDRKAAECRAEAAEIRAGGGKSTGAAKKLAKLQSQMDEMLAELSGKLGPEAVEAIKQKVAKQLEEKAKAAAEAKAKEAAGTGNGSQAA